RVESELVPGSVLGRAMIRVLCARTRRDCERMMQGLRAFLRDEAPAPYGEGVDLTPPALSAATRESLREADPELRAEALAPRLLNLTAVLAADLYVVPEAPPGPVSAAFGEGAGLKSGAGRTGAGRSPITVENRTAARQQVILERMASYEERATAAVVSVYQEF